MRDAEWEDCREADGSLNLAKLWLRYGSVSDRNITSRALFSVESGLLFLGVVEAYRPIVSRQVAALALATADALAALSGEEPKCE